MTPEQSVYKMLKYMTKNYYYAREEIPNKFIYTGDIKLNINEYDNTYDKNIYIDFTTKKANWNTSRYDYNFGEYIHKQGDLNWGEFMCLLQPGLENQIANEIGYKLLKEETERTNKVRKLRTKCIMNRELNAIEGLTV